MDLDAPNDPTAPRPPVRRLLWVAFALIAVGAVAVGLWVASGDDELVPDQAELQAVLDSAVDGLTLPERQLSGLDRTCLKPIDECGPALVADYQLGSIDEVCAMVEEISVRIEVEERDDEACWVAGRLDGHPIVVEIGVGSEATTGAPLTLIVL